ncbi:MAG: hypothetical protein U0Z17_10395 [Bacteroidales bacterium]
MMAKLGDDPGVTKNLGAEAISKVQVYNENQNNRSLPALMTAPKKKP